jgi:hypothetical protein
MTTRFHSRKLAAVGQAGRVTLSPSFWCLGPGGIGAPPPPPPPPLGPGREEVEEELEDPLELGTGIREFALEGFFESVPRAFGTFVVEGCEV